MVEGGLAPEQPYFQDSTLRPGRRKCYNNIEASALSMAFKPAFAQGAQIEHSKYGLGSVASCTEEYIVIKFDDHGEKKFVLSIALPALKKSDRQPPVEKRRAARKKAAPAAAQ
jgi:hypothetical protein